MTDEPINPVRVCCGQRHQSVVCPDGKVMCCLCFERVTQSALRHGPDGNLVDVCRECEPCDDECEYCQ